MEEYARLHGDEMQLWRDFRAACEAKDDKRREAVSAQLSVLRREVMAAYRRAREECFGVVREDGVRYAELSPDEQRMLELAGMGASDYQASFNLRGERMILRAP